MGSCSVKDIPDVLFDIAEIIALKARDDNKEDYLRGLLKLAYQAMTENEGKKHRPQILKLIRLELDEAPAA